MISNIIYHSLCYVQWVNVRGDCSFCWYWRNCWPSLLKISFLNVQPVGFFGFWRDWNAHRCPCDLKIHIWVVIVQWGIIPSLIAWENQYYLFQTTKCSGITLHISILQYTIMALIRGKHSDLSTREMLFSRGLAWDKTTCQGLANLNVYL